MVTGAVTGSGTVGEVVFATVSSVSAHTHAKHLMCYARVCVIG